MKKRCRGKQFTEKEELTKEEKEKLQALLKAHKVKPIESWPRRSHKMYKMTPMAGPFRVPKAMLPRIHYWLLVFAKFPADHVLIYDQKRRFIVKHIKVPGGSNQPGERKYIRQRKVRKRFLMARRNFGKARASLYNLARIERNAIYKERIYWKKKRKLCDEWKTSRMLHRACRRAFRFHYSRIDKERWAGYFAKVKPKDIQTKELIEADPRYQGRLRYRLFRIAAGSSLAWRSSYRAYYQKGLAFELKYRPYIQKILRQGGLPVQLAALPFVESMYNPWVSSGVGAAGLWQLMPNTAKEIGLYTSPKGKQWLNYPIDERKDPMYATTAAVRFIKTCRHFFKRKSDWPLAVTSYNQGPGRVLKAVKLAKTRLIERIIRKPREQSFGKDGKNFYAKFLAAIFLRKNYKRFFPDENSKPLLFNRWVLPCPLWPSFIKKITGLDRKSLLLYNPSLKEVVRSRRYPVPAFFPLRLPKDISKEAHKTLVDLRDKKKKSFAHEVQKKETILKLARRYRVSAYRTLYLNRTQTLFKDKQQKQSQACYSKAQKESTKSRKRAKKQACKQKDIKKLLLVSKIVQIPAYSSFGLRRSIRIHIVKDHEPLAFLACRACTTIWHLRKLNQKLPIKRLKVGTRLRVPRCPRYLKRHFRNCYPFHYQNREKTQKEKEKVDKKGSSKKKK